MKFKTYTGITWSLLELTGLLEDEESCVYFEKFKKHFGLHPFHLTNLNASLNEILSSNLNSYDSELKGFLLAYQNPKLLTPLGEIFYDTCFIHIDVEVEFYVFRPKVGSCIKGIVNKKGVDHIGVLVHKAFNVSIPKPDDDENWLGDNLEIGQEVKFVVTLLDIDSKLPFIRGTLDPDNYLQGCKLMEKTFNHKTQHRDVVKNNVKNEHSVTQKKQHTFFDSEDSSDQDAVQVKKETPKKNRRKSFEQDEVIEYNEDSEDKKNIKKVKESKSKKKSKGYSSQSSIDEHVDVRSEKSPKKLPRRLSSVEPENEFRKIKAEISENINRKQMKEEIVSESESKPKKSSAKRKHLDVTDNLADDLTADKYIRNSSKKTIKKCNVLDTNTNGILNNVKVEPFNSHSSSESVDVVESPSKKKHKKQKNIKEEDSAQNSYDIDDENEDNRGKKKRKKHSKKGLLDISEIKVEPTFEDVVIKIEEPDDMDSPNKTIGEPVDHDIHTNRSKNRDSVNKELKAHKTKIKKEKSLSNSISDEEKQELKTHKVKVKKEKSVAYSVSDEDMEVVKVGKVKPKKENLVTHVASAEDQIDTHNQNVKITKKHNKNSPRKESSESEVDLSRVKVKIEKSTHG